MDYIRVRLLLAKLPEDTEPCVVAAVDEAIWDHWDDDEEAAWIEGGKRTWGLSEPDSQFRQVRARFAPQALADAFTVPEVDGEIESEPDA